MAKKKKEMTLEEKLEEAIVMDGPYEVPGNWVWSKLRIFCDFIDYRGKTPNKTDDGIRLITAKNIKKGYISLNPEEFIANSDYDTWMTRGIPKYGDVIITTEAPLGNVAQLFLTEKYALAQRAITLSIIDGMIQEYLKFVLLSPSIQESINQMATGTTVKGIKASKLKELLIPLPPLKEQQRIVHRIESLFEKLDKAKELIEEAREGFEKRKSAILERAFRGELTEILDTSNLEDLLVVDNIDFNMFKSRYKLSSLNKIIEEKPRNGYSPKSVEYETSTKTLKLGAITRGYFNPNEFKYIDEIIDKDSYLWLKRGDFLIQRANSLEYVGISAIYDMEDDIFIYPDLIMKFRVKKDIYNPKLLWYWINSRYGRWYFTNNATGTAGNMPKINQKVVMKLPIPIITLREQEEIVEILDKFVEEEKKIEELTQLEEQIELIKKSILAKAFRGELGTNCEEDESGLELLKEIVGKQ